MQPFYDLRIAKQAYQERLQAVEDERRWLALRRRQPSVLTRLAGAVHEFVGAHRPARSGSYSAAARNA